MRIIFAGTPTFAATALEAILAAGHSVALVLTQPDRPAGRGMKLAASAVKLLALREDLPVFQPARLRDADTHMPIKDAAADLMVVAAYGLILPQAVLDLPSHGCLNIHASLLPRWRGAAPIQRCLLAGDAETGISIMQMDAGLDTGPILLQRALAIAADDSAASLHDKLARLGAEAIVEAMARRQELQVMAQPSQGVTYAAKIDKAESALDWRLSAAQLDRRVRAFEPTPGATAKIADTTLKICKAMPVEAQGEPGRILAVDAEGVLVACGAGALRLLELQRPGSRRLPVGEFLRGYALSAGDCFVLPGDLQSATDA